MSWLDSVNRRAQAERRGVAEVLRSQLGGQTITGRLFRA
jgi:hypothetical protein